MSLEWHSLFIQQTNAVMTLWNVYIVVVFALVGFIAQKGDTLKRRDKVVCISGFIVFAAANCYSLSIAQDAAINIYQQIKVKPAIFTEPTIWPPLLQALFSIVIVIFITKWKTKTDNKTF